MSRLSILNRSGVLSVQVAMACLVLALVSVAPPARGAILILSLTGEHPGEIARWAIAHDARLIGAGPVPNSLVVEGTRTALMAASVRHAGLLLAGSGAACGDRP